jgi:acetoin utilization protein AcuB
MLVSQLILRNVPVLAPDKALAEVFPEDYPEGLDYAPVLDQNEFLGLLSLSDLEEEQEMHQLVADCHLEKIAHSVKESQHVFEIFPLFQKTGLPVLPVFNDENLFEGLISLDAIASSFSASYGFQTEGGTLVLSIPAVHYALSEVSRLVEANQGKVLSVLVEADPVLSQNYLVHLKINQPDLSRIVATLERFEYHVLEVHQALEPTSIDKDRFDQLMRYLGI